jgi:hypothetical protein
MCVCVCVCVCVYLSYVCVFVFASLYVLVISDVEINTGINKYHTGVNSQHWKAFLPSNRHVTAETCLAATCVMQLQSADPSF